jgi:hypothetical protein
VSTRANDRRTAGAGTAAPLAAMLAMTAARAGSSWDNSRRMRPLSERTAETYTAHSIAAPAVQFNKVYPTPCTARVFAHLRLGVR